MAEQQAGAVAPEPSAEEIEKAKTFDAPMLHASTVNVQGTGNDFLLTFLRPRPAKSGTAFANFAIAEPVAVVTISPQTLKDISISIAEAVASHEKLYGELVTPFTQSRAKNAGTT